MTIIKSGVNVHGDDFCRNAEAMAALEADLRAKIGRAHV